MQNELNQNPFILLLKSEQQSIWWQWKKFEEDNKILIIMSHISKLFN